MYKFEIINSKFETKKQIPTTFCGPETSQLKTSFHRKISLQKSTGLSHPKYQIPAPSPEIYKLIIYENNDICHENFVTVMVVLTRKDILKEKMSSVKTLNIIMKQENTKFTMPKSTLYQAPFRKGITG